MADAYYLSGAMAAALPEYLHVTRLDPTAAMAWSNAGAIFRELGEPQNALGALHQALALDPSNALALNNSGLAFADLGEHATARECFTMAIALKPDHDAARWNRAIVDLLCGDFANGWEGHEYRTVQLGRIGGLRSFPEPRWTGEQFDGKRLLVWPEQGLGDQLQFIRFLPRVKALGGTVVLACAAPLVTLLEGCVSDADEIVVVDASYDRCDLQLPLMSLPHVLGLGDELDTARVPYVAPSGEMPSKVAALTVTAPDDSRPLVGIVWAGQPKHQNDHNRSIALETLYPLLARHDVRWIALQKGERAEAQLDAVNARLMQEGFDPVVSASDALHDFNDTGHLMSRLDLLVTVDTGVAHLAGAMGVPAFILLPFVPDWRWQVGRADSPWYPQTRLFRQTVARQWADVIDAISLAFDTTLATPMTA